MKLLSVVCVTVALCMTAARAHDDGDEPVDPEKLRTCSQACGEYHFAGYQCSVRKGCRDQDPLNEEAIKDCDDECYQHELQCMNLCKQNYETILQMCESQCNDNFEPFCESRCFSRKFKDEHSKELPKIEASNQGIFAGVPFLENSESAEDQDKRTLDWSWEDFEDDDDWW